MPSTFTSDHISPGHVHVDRLAVSGPLEHAPIGDLLYKPVPGTDGSVYAVGAEAHKPKRRKRRDFDDIFVKSHTLDDRELTNAIRFDCCPPMVLQEHNVFGHTSVRSYANEIYLRQKSRYGLPSTADEDEYWSNGEVGVSHLHIAGNFWLEPAYKMMVFDAVDANNPTGKHRDAETCIRLGFQKDGTHSPFHTATLYDKHCLLAQEWSNPGPLQKALMEVARTSIRLEFKIYSQWLRTYGVDQSGNIVNRIEAIKKDKAALRSVRSLHWAGSWDYVDLNRVFFDLVNRYQITNSIQPLLTSDELASLTKAEAKAYTLWLEGHRLENFYGRTARHTLAWGIFEKTQIDVRAARRPSRLPPIHLKNVFCPANLVSVPEAVESDSRRYWQPSGT